MGTRKKNRADAIKAAKKQVALAKLKNSPSSPRKMRLVANLVRGVEVNKALQILKFNTKHASANIEKLDLSAVANWQAKNEGVSLEEANLCIKEISVDCGSSLKRLRPAPQGRGHRIRKRSNHVTVVLGSAANQPTETK